MRCSFTLAAIAFCLSAVAADGDPDRTFGIDGIAHAGVADAGSSVPTHPVVQADGKILFCGTRSADGATGSDFFVARFTADGSYDTSFSFDGKVTIDFDNGIVAAGDVCSALAVQADGKIVAAGYTQKADFSSAFAVARLNADGTLDTSFGAGSGKATYVFDAADFDNAASAVAIQADGKIVLAGVHRQGANGDFAVLRLLASGALDATFGTKGKTSIAFDLPGSTSKDDVATGVAIDAAGNIIIGGSADAGLGNIDFAVARLSPDGKPDANFNADGHETIAFAITGGTGKHAAVSNSLLIQRDGRIVLAGACDGSTTPASNLDMAAARIFPDGSLDRGFGSGGLTTIPFDLVSQGIDDAFDVVEQGDGKLVLGGDVSAAAGGRAGAAARLNSDGSLDDSFACWADRPTISASPWRARKSSLAWRCRGNRSSPWDSWDFPEWVRTMSSCACLAMMKFSGMDSSRHHCGCAGTVTTPSEKNTTLPILGLQVIGKNLIHREQAYDIFVGPADDKALS